jgi:hypothetical protein
LEELDAFSPPKEIVTTTYNITGELGIQMLTSILVLLLHPVTHDFGHLDGVLMMVYSGS